MTMASTIIEALTRSATEDVLGLVLEECHRMVIVDSPPGAGKTHLIESVVSLARANGLRVAVVAPTNEQTFDLVRRLLNNFHSNRVELWLAQGRELPADLAARSDRQTVFRAIWGSVKGPEILVATVAKLGNQVVDYPTHEPSFDLLVCDEAYQVTYENFMPLAHLAHQYLLVGDPGQLAPPLGDIDLRRFEAAPHKVHWPAPREVLRKDPSTPRVQLPVSRRLNRDTVEIVQPCFYQHMPFIAAATDAERRVTFAIPGIGTGPVDETLRKLSGGASIVGMMLPERTMPVVDVDREVVDAMADVVWRLLECGVTWSGERQLTPGDIGCVDPHVISNQALREELAARGLPVDEIKVEVPELWQGLERPIIVAKHPLTGKRRLGEFELDPGRWCVSLSRHLLGCVIVGRNGIDGALDRHQHDSAARAVGADDTEWMGIQAHQRLWDELERRGRLIAA